MSKGVNQVLPVFLALLFITVASLVAFNVMSSQSQSVNLSEDPAYAASYNNSETTKGLTWGIFPIVGLVLAIGLLFGGVKSLWK